MVHLQQCRITTRITIQFSHDKRHDEKTYRKPNEHTILFSKNYAKLFVVNCSIGWLDADVTEQRLISNAQSRCFLVTFHVQTRERMNYAMI